MRAPVKLNKNNTNKFLNKLLPTIEDPRKILNKKLDLDNFDKSISAIKIDTTWKSTFRDRHSLTDKLIIKTIIDKSITPSILEVGASTGATSLSLLDKLNGNFNRFYITDLFFNLPYRMSGDTTFFYHPKNLNCIMRVNNLTVIYRDKVNLWFPIGWLSNIYLNNSPKYRKSECKILSMVHPEIIEISKIDRSIIIEEYDIFTSWKREPVDIIKVCNILNITYFSEKEIINALRNLKAALKPGGYLFLTDNRKFESVSVFFYDLHGKFRLVKEKNGGSSITSILGKEF